MYIQPSGTGLIGQMAKSSVYLALSEDYLTVTTAPAFYAAGGIEFTFAYGLGTWAQFLISLSSDGAAITSITNEEYITGYKESLVQNSVTASTNYKGMDFGTNGCMTATDYAHWTVTAVTSVHVAGVTASSRNCLEWAIDGYSVTGVTTFYLFVQGTGNSF